MKVGILLLSIFLIKTEIKSQTNYYEITTHQEPQPDFSDLHYAPTQSLYTPAPVNDIKTTIDQLNTAWHRNKDEYDNFISNANNHLDGDGNSLKHRCQVYALDIFINTTKEWAEKIGWEHAHDIIQIAEQKYYKDLSEYPKIEATATAEKKIVADGYCNNADESLKLNENSAAIEYCNKALDAFPNYPNALAVRVKAYYALRDFSNALQDINYLIINYPSNSYGYYERAIVYATQEKLDLALIDYNKLVELKPDNPDVYDQRGKVKNKLKDYQGAIQDITKAIELNPNESRYYFNRGISKGAIQDYYGAIADNKKAVELKPDFSMAYNNIAWNKFLQKKIAEALIDANKSIELDSTNATAFDTRGEIKFNLNDLKGCIGDFDSALKYNPKLSNSYFLRGRAYLKLQDKAPGCEDLSKAGELGKKEAYEFIAKYCQ